MNTYLDEYLRQEWDYVITVCGGANESCPVFTGKVVKRLHIGFDDPDAFKGTEDEILPEFRRVRDEIKRRMQDFYLKEVKGFSVDSSNMKPTKQDVAFLNDQTTSLSNSQTPKQPKRLNN